MKALPGPTINRLSGFALPTNPPQPSAADGCPDHGFAPDPCCPLCPWPTRGAGIFCELCGDDLPSEYADDTFPMCGACIEAALNQPENAL